MQIKNLSATANSSTQFEAARRRLEGWRRRHKYGAAVPGEIWAAAVLLAEQMGVSKTAQTFGLNYYSLKKRMESDGQNGSSEQGATTDFVELVSAVREPFPELIVELEHPGGAKLRIQFKGQNGPELV